MLNEIKNIRITNQNLKQFGFLIGSVLICISLYLLYESNHHLRFYLFAVGIGLLIVAYIVPTILKPFYIPWMVLANILGWFMSRLILSLLFFFIFTPIGLVGRIIGYSFIELKWNKDKKTYWNYRNDQIKEDHLNQF